MLLRFCPCSGGARSTRPSPSMPDKKSSAKSKTKKKAPTGRHHHDVEISERGRPRGTSIPASKDEAFSASAPDSRTGNDFRAHILIINTGGTLGMEPNAAGQLAPTSGAITRAASAHTLAGRLSGMERFNYAHDFCVL